MPDGEYDFHWQRIINSVGPTTLVYTQTTYTKSQTDYVRVFVVKDGEIDELTYSVAAVSNYRANPDRGGLALRGGGYSKGLDVFLAVCKIANVDADQTKWRAL